MSVLITDLVKNYIDPDARVCPVVNIKKLNLPAKEHIALIGSSGSGKTTLLHLIAGILTPDSGHIRHGDVDITGLSEPARDAHRGRHIGYIFQTHHLLPGFTAMENVLLGMSFTGRSPDKPWARHLLKTVGLEQRLHYPPAKLSLGQQQRVAVARALANRPSLVLADEPTGSLDAENALQTLTLIRQLRTESNATLLLVTHDNTIATQFPTVLNLHSINHAREVAP